MISDWNFNAHNLIIRLWDVSLDFSDTFMQSHVWPVLQPSSSNWQNMKSCKDWHSFLKASSDPFNPFQVRIPKVCLSGHMCKAVVFSAVGWVGCGGVNRCLGSLECWNGSFSRCTAAGRGTAETDTYIYILGGSVFTQVCSCVCVFRNAMQTNVGNTIKIL